MGWSRVRVSTTEAWIRATRAKNKAIAIKRWHVNFVRSPLQLAEESLSRYSTRVVIDRQIGTWETYRPNFRSPHTHLAARRGGKKRIRVRREGSRHNVGMLIKIRVVRVTRRDTISSIFGSGYAHVRSSRCFAPAAFYFAMHVKNFSGHTRKSHRLFLVTWLNGVTRSLKVVHARTHARPPAMKIQTRNMKMKVKTKIANATARV